MDVDSGKDAAVVMDTSCAPPAAGPNGQPPGPARAASARAAAGASPAGGQPIAATRKVLVDPW
eukprot:4150951-Lingulodinium_polyedra.AAC.1